MLKRRSVFHHDRHVPISESRLSAPLGFDSNALRTLNPMRIFTQDQVLARLSPADAVDALRQALRERVSDCLCAGAWFTSSPRIGRGMPRLVG